MSSAPLTVIKYCVIGQTHSGKSKLVQAIAEGTYDDDDAPTIGVD